MATYDAQGHLLTFFLNASPRCIVGSQQPGPEVEPGCSHAYSSPELGRVPQTQAPPLGAGSQARVTSSSVEDLLDYLLK
jgi:hypothetical protein